MTTRFFSSSLLSFFALAPLVASSAMLVTTAAHAQMSDVEKKAAARAAYQEGVKLQDDGKAADALARFESAEKLFDAPTHLLHIAECQALTGRLVEASETYELLARKSLPTGSPDAFVQAQQQGQAELPALRQRVPTLRVTVKPGPQQVQNLQVNVNGVLMPNELLGIARPLNPGTYRFSAQAVGWSTAASVDVPLPEKEQKSVELVLVPRAGAGVMAAAPPPVGAPPVATLAAPPPPPYERNPEGGPRVKPGPTSSGLLLGVRGGVIIPSGKISQKLEIDDFATTGGAFGIDAYLRLAKMLLLGATFEYAGLGTPSRTSTVPAGITAETSAHATYIGVNLGIVPNVDKVSFIGDIGLGSRTLAFSATGANLNQDTSATGLEFALGAGLSIPAGPLRLVPRLNLGVGSFSSSKATVSGGSTSADIGSGDSSTHTFFFAGLAAYYSFDFGAKVAER